MRVAFGLKAHSGWAALVVLGTSRGEPAIVDRRRIDLVDARDLSWAKQPYHAGRGLDPDSARALVASAFDAALRCAVRELRAAVERTHKSEHDVVGCAVLVAEPMPGWSIDEILAVHIRMHKAEGVLFPEALVRAAEACGLGVLVIPEKRLTEQAEQALAAPLEGLMTRIEALGKSVGSPWGKDQKSAALAAMIALAGCAK